MKKKDKIPDPTIARLPIYFRCLTEMKNNNISVVSSDEISTMAGVKASQFRKDMSYFGEFGIQGLGYPVVHLMERISTIMQLDKTHEVALIGVGNLGLALAKYNGFSKWNFRISYLYDNNPDVIGTVVNDIVIEDINNIPEKLDVSVGILTVPREFAQEVADKLINSGVKLLLNFTATFLNVPPDVIVRNVDLTHELAILTYHLESGEAGK
jgi:redox-sensing transcriptional repressor